MIYNFTVKLKGLEFKYKTEADNVTDAMIKVRNHIKNAVELTELKSDNFEVPSTKSNEFINFFNDMIKK
jgi:hypothetical protein